MSTRRKHHPDHYQAHPPPPADEALYRDEAVKLRTEPPARPHAAHPQHPHRVEAGHLLEHASLLRCEGCKAERHVPAHTLVGPCAGCEGRTYRAVG